jgi:predicted PurR-regulated permease PerM
LVTEQSGHSPFSLPTTLWRSLALIIVLAVAVLLGSMVFNRFLRVATTILVFSAILTYLLQPFVEWSVHMLRTRHDHVVRVAVVLLVYLAIAVGLFGIGSSTARTVARQAQELQATWTTAGQHIPQQIVSLQRWYARTVPSTIQAQVTASVQRSLQDSSHQYIPRVVAWVFGLAKTAGEWVGWIIELIFVPLVAFYFLTDRSRVREHFLFFVPSRHRQAVMQYAGGMDDIFRQYIRGQLILCAVAWAVVTIALLIMQVPGAILLGVIAGVARAIPVIGPVVGGIPVLATVLLDPQWSGAFWWVLIGFSALHLFESKFLMPRILGDHLDVHPVLVILSLLVGYELLGLLGMFIAPPTVAVIRLILAVRRGEGPFAVAGSASEPEKLCSPSLSGLA